MILCVALTLMMLLRPIAQTVAQDAPPSVPAAQLDPTVDVKWMQLLYDRVEAEKISAPAASRLYAYAGITTYQAVLPGIPEGISMSGQVGQLPDMPQIDQTAIYDWPSSANGALSTVISGLFPKDA